MEVKRKKKTRPYNCSVLKLTPVALRAFQILKARSPKPVGGGWVGGWNEVLYALRGRMGGWVDWTYQRIWQRPRRS